MMSRFIRLFTTCRFTQVNGIMLPAIHSHQCMHQTKNFLSNDYFTPLNYQIRNYAKGKDKKKSNKGKGTKVEINETVISSVINLDKMKGELEHAVNKMKDEFIQNLSLRSNTGAIENLKVNFEGKNYLMMELAQIVRKNPTTIIINMAAFPQVIPATVKALSTSGMNLNPQQDGTSIYIPVPKVTKEHRQVLAKNAKALFVKCRDNVRDVQNRFVRTIKNKENDGLAEDVSHEVSQQVVFISDQYIQQAEKMMEAKQAELLSEKL